FEGRAGYQRVPPVNTRRSPIQSVIGRRDHLALRIVVAGRGQSVADKELIAPGEPLLRSNIHRFVLGLGDRVVEKDAAPGGQRTHASGRVIQVFGPIIPERVGENSIHMDREIPRQLPRISAGELLGVRISVVSGNHRNIRRSSGAKRSRALAAIGIRITRTPDQHVALGQVPIFPEVLKSLEIVVVDPEAGPDDIASGSQDVPRQTEARAEVVIIATLTRVAQERNRLRKRFRIEALTERAVFTVPPQSKTQRQVTSNSPVILNEGTN